jgi:hypothetical protein
MSQEINWYATPELRWRDANKTGPGPFLQPGYRIAGILQQKWVSDDGAEEWREVPVVGR